MTDILFVAATAPELNIPEGDYQKLITGPGILSTSYHLTSALNRGSFKLAVNLGICGSLDEAVAPGTLVLVTSDQLADFGAEDGEHFLPAQDINLLDPAAYPFTNGKLQPVMPANIQALNGLLQRPGITVQKVHGSTATAAAAKQRFGPAVESMEGAAFFYCCMQQHVPCIQVRAVSNMVERRNRKSWRMEEALHVLNDFTIRLIASLESTASKSSMR